LLARLRAAARLPQNQAPCANRLGMDSFFPVQLLRACFCHPTSIRVFSIAAHSLFARPMNRNRDGQFRVRATSLKRRASNAGHAGAPV
jgi:hypothetical protein